MISLYLDIVNKWIKCIICVNQRIIIIFFVRMYMKPNHKALDLYFHTVRLYFMNVHKMFNCRKWSHNELKPKSISFCWWNGAVHDRVQRTVINDFVSYTWLYWWVHSIDNVMGRLQLRIKISVTKLDKRCTTVSATEWWLYESKWLLERSFL